MVEKNGNQDMKVSFVGAGNVATHLSKALMEAGYRIVGVHTRSYESAAKFAEYCHCLNAPHLEDLPESDIYIFSIKDDALAQVISDFGRLHRHGLCIHTAGSVPISVFSNQVSHYAVMYPLQTFSKSRSLDFKDVPLFIEAEEAEDLAVVSTLALAISKEVHLLSSEDRKKLHLAAVFACNFSNHCFAIASDLLEKASLPEHLLLPLIHETCAKLEDLPAVKGQTGPAVRYDEKVMENQMQLLGDDELRKSIYKLMSASIHEYAMKRK